MNEKTTLEIIAPTVEEALAQGLSQLSLPAEAVSMEVLDAGSKGLFGMGGRQVRIRLTIKTDEEPVPTPKTPPASKPGPKPVPAKKATPKPQETAPSPHQAKGESDRLLTLTEETVSKLLAHMNLQARVSARYDDNDRNPHSGGSNRQAIDVDVRGDDLSILIGRRSETLNALQYVASLMVGKQVEQWVQLYLDVEGYRSRRERQLRQMARRMAEQAAKSGRRQTLEPMAAAERRIIHLELRDHPDVTTESAGEEPHRKVNIMPKHS